MGRLESFLRTLVHKNAGNFEVGIELGNLQIEVDALVG